MEGGGGPSDSSVGTQQAQGPAWWSASTPARILALHSPRPAQPQPGYHGRRKEAGGPGGQALAGLARPVGRALPEASKARAFSWAVKPVQRCPQILLRPAPCHAWLGSP